MTDVDTDDTAAPQADQSNDRLKSWLSAGLRVLVSVAALAFVFSRVPLDEIAARVTTLDVGWTVAAFAAVYASIVVSAIKWGVLLRARGFELPLTRLVHHYLVGLFFNNFLPTSVGGDVVRAWDAGRDIGNAPEGAASVITERLIASVALGITAAIGLPFVDAGGQAVLAVAVVLVASLGLVALFFLPSKTDEMIGKSMGGRFDGVRGWVGRATAAVRGALSQRSTVLTVFALSVLFQLFVAAVNLCLFKALGAPVSFGEAIVFTSIVSAVTMVPISISGHGVREAGYAYFFGLAGANQTDAVTASLLFFAVVALATLPGALLFMQGRRKEAR